MKVIPQGNNIYIEPLKDEQILKRPADDSITERGKVISTGEKVSNFQEGDIVLFNAFLANKVEIQGDSYYFVTPDDIFAKVDETG